MNTHSLLRRITLGRVLVVSGLGIPLLFTGAIYALVAFLSGILSHGSEPYMNKQDWSQFRLIVINIEALYLIAFTALCGYGISKSSSGLLIFVAGLVTGVYWGWFLKP